MTVDEHLVETAQDLGAGSLSSLVNMALANELDRRARHASLGRLLSSWEAELGPVPVAEAEAASAGFGDLDASAALPQRSARSRGRHGAA